MIAPVKVTHTGIEYEGEQIAEFKSSFPEYKRRELRDEIHSAMETDYIFQEGDLIPLEEFIEVNDELKRLVDKRHETESELESLLHDLDNILETVGKKTEIKFKDFYANLTTAYENSKP